MISAAAAPSLAPADALGRRDQSADQMRKPGRRVSAVAAPE